MQGRASGRRGLAILTYFILSFFPYLPLFLFWCSMQIFTCYLSQCPLFHSLEVCFFFGIPELFFRLLRNPRKLTVSLSSLSFPSTLCCDPGFSFFLPFIHSMAPPTFFSPSTLYSVSFSPPKFKLFHFSTVFFFVIMIR